MKLFFGVILCLSIGLSVGFPAVDPNDDAEIVIVPKGQQGVPSDKTEDSDDSFFKSSGFPFTQSSFGFNIGFSDSFADIFRRFHSRFNPFGPTDSKEEDDDAIAFPAFGLPIPEGANTTHSVQVVDGHKVEINNTVYEKKGDFGNSVFKVRIINVRPLESGEEVDVGTKASGTTSAPPKKPTPSTRESAEDQDDEINDINSGVRDPESTVTTIAPPNESTITPEEEAEDVSATTLTTPPEETTSSASFASNNVDADSDNEKDNEELSTESAAESSESSESINNNYGNKNGNIEYEFELENGNHYDSAALNNKKLEKLEYINNFSSSNNNNSPQQNPQNHPLQDEFSADTDSEEVAEQDGSNFNGNSEWDSVESGGNFENTNQDNNIYGNDIDLYAPESVPVDLSNDIAVNDMLADQGFVDPDAEVFDVNELVFPEGHKTTFAKLELYEPIKRK